VNPPWRFYASYQHDPMLYGYRALVVEWDYTAVADCTSPSDSASTAYRLSGEDEASFIHEVDERPDDFHRQYCPYRRLVGAAVMNRFNRASASTSVEMRGTSSLAEFVRRLQGSSFARDHIQPVYRPITTLSTFYYTAGDYNDQPTRTGGDDWYAMTDDHRSVVNHTDQPSSVSSEYYTTSNVRVTLTPSTAVSNLLPVVPEVSAEDQPNGNGTEVRREAVAQCPLVNGKGDVEGSGQMELHCSDELRVVDDVRVNKPAEISTTTSSTVIQHTTIVHQLNGDALNNLPLDDVPVNGSVHRVICTTELPDNGSDVVRTSSASYMIDDANRRTIRSDL